jgi:DNA polymerase
MTVSLHQDVIRTEMLSLVKSLKGQVADHQNSYVNMDLERKLPKNKVVSRDSGKREELLNEVCHEAGDCESCQLSRTRKHVVFGDGNPEANIVFVGEAPGADEDEQGLPFVGRAGQLLTNIIKAMGLERKDVYICNILKCRPPGNRNPLPEEIRLCESYLKRQLAIISPKVICALGTFAAHTLLQTDIPITQLRGRFHSYQGIKLMPTYHPAYLLRNPAAKKPVWDDIQMIMKEAGIPS